MHEADEQGLAGQPPARSLSVLLDGFQGGTEPVGANGMAQIPYEAQQNVGTSRRCAAAALNMVYRSYGLSVPQGAVWRVITVPDGLGGLFAKTYRLPFDAMLRGLSAVALKALDPIAALQTALAADVRVIMNHRQREDTGLGHFTVALHADASGVAFHDPELGPDRRLDVGTLRALWQPAHNPCEIAGNILIAVAQQPPQPGQCGACGTAVPTGMRCSECLHSFPLQPTVALGCSNAACTSRLWEVVVCPFCDALLG